MATGKYSVRFDNGIEPAAHPPPGAHRHVRRAAYAMSFRYGHEQNVGPKREPQDPSEFFLVAAATRSAIPA